MTAKVVVTDYTFPDLKQEEAASRTAGADFAAHQAGTGEEVAAAVAGAQVALVQFAPFTAAAAQAMEPGGTVIRYGVGYDNIDLDAAAAAGLSVGYVPDYCAEEVADHTAAAALTLLRKLVPLDASLRGGDWAAVAVARPMKPFSQTVIGFFGLGQIGQAVMARLRGFGFTFIAHDPGLDASDAAQLGVELVDVDRLLADADLLSLHAPATPQTIGFLNAERLARMKPEAMIVNSARGQLIVEEDLAAALGAGGIGGAALDVFRTEPLPADSPLRAAPNLILTPHAAWYSEAAIANLQRLVAEDVTRALAGQPPRRPVPGTGG
ncbi:NAD(P)-dependent oxidoreductase [Oceanomicrobium pacificus]|uniref:C-terminal binding protein n=1 Tax=Oceanomicrobium pacificus TaxID=2692916 RepID=A0A6B0TKX7_9RHOB|nr:NAD(P)-dependent oxidoreductase [Oceanomicrobium pacificus]MXU65147.1 C-terminal binding protein [Oceanomicrobium pacificus]